MDLTDPKVLVSLGAIVAGLVAATRATQISSRWLPLVSAGWGVVVAFAATVAGGGPLTGAALGMIVIVGLGLGLGTTGIVAVTTHATTGSTDGASTAAKGGA